MPCRAAVLALMTTLTLSVPLHADLVIQYSKKTSNSSLSITFSAGSSYSYGLGGYYPYSFPSYGYGGSSIFVAGGGSFYSYNGYVLPGVYYTSPFATTDPSYYDDPLGFAYRDRSRPTRQRAADAAAFDAESLRRKYYGIEGKDSYIPAGGEGTVAARLARTETVRAGLTAFHDGRYVDATLKLREAYLRDTRDAGTKILYGISLVPLGEYEPAEKAIRRGIEETASGSDWLVEVPKLYGNTRDYGQHLLLLRHRRDQDDPRRAAFLLVYYLAAEEKWSEARRYLDLLGENPGKAADLLRVLIESRLQQ